MDFFPADPKKIKARIRSYERSLERAHDDDGYGKRYLLGPMYLLLGDVPGAMKHYAWFRAAYSDDGGEPYNELCWALTLYLGGEKKLAESKLRKAIFSNLYLVPHLIGHELSAYPIWHGSNFAEQEYARSIPRELIEIWTKDALAWAREYYFRPDFQNDLAQYVQIEEQVKNENPGPLRTELLRKAWAIADPEKGNRLGDGLGHLHLIPGGNEK